MEYIFTFGIGMPLAGHYLRIKARSWDLARQKMFELHGTEWAFQYEATYWDTVIAYKPFAETQYGPTIDAMDLEVADHDR